MLEKILAADIGTSSLKAAIVTSSGQIIATSRHSYRTHITPEGWTEQAPSDWLDALANALRALDEKCDLGDISGIVLTGQMSAALLVDGEHMPVRPCIIWSDQRSDSQAKAAEESAGKQHLYALTGNPPTATYSAAKLAWLARHEPEAMRRARYFLQPKDWLVAQLTGKAATDTSDASCTNLIDLRKGQWDPSLFSLYGLESRIAPEILRSTDVIGTVQPAIAAKLGLKAGLPVVLGGGDGPATAAGAGALAEGAAYVSLGTSAWASFTSSDPVIDPACRLATFAHIIPGLYVETGSMQAAGASLEWAAHALNLTAGELAEIALAAPLPSGAKPFFLPYLQGERTPYWSALPAGTFFGLNREHGRSDISSAVLEGVCYQMRLILDVFKELGRQAQPLILAGGFGKSALFERHFANLTGRAVRTLAQSEQSTALGAAIAGFMGLGILKSPNEAAQWLNLGEVVKPAVDADLVTNRYATFREAWPHAEALASLTMRAATNQNERN